MTKTLAWEYEMESKFVRAAKKEGVDLLRRSHFERWDWGERNGMVTNDEFEQAHKFYGDRWYEGSE